MISYMKASERQQKLKNDDNETFSLLQLLGTIYILKISHSVYFYSLLVIDVLSMCYHTGEKAREMRGCFDYSAITCHVRHRA